MKTKPIISVILPTYNREIPLGELLQSLVLQTFSSFEVIIVNDAGESVRSVIERYPELSIRYEELTENVGHVHARNRAVEYAQGEYILLMDDDDLLVPTHLETMYEAIYDADLVYSDAEIFHYEWNEWGRVVTNRTIFAYEYTLEGMRSFSSYIPSGSLYRRSLHEEIGLFDGDIHNYWDWDFFLRVADQHRIKRVPIAGVLYAWGGSGNQSAQLNSKRGAYLQKLCEKHGLGQLPQKNFWDIRSEPEVQARETTTTIVWDGVIIPARPNETKNPNG